MPKFTGKAYGEDPPSQATYPASSHIDEPAGEEDQCEAVMGYYSTKNAAQTCNTENLSSNVLPSYEQKHVRDDPLEIEGVQKQHLSHRF
eukprot:252915-Pyramimonas_sp.AAC.1